MIKGGVVDGKAMTPDEITKLASLESREVLLAKLAGAMKASMGNAAAVFNALPVKAAQLAEALRVKRESEEARLLRRSPPTRRPRRRPKRPTRVDPAVVTDL